MLYQAVSSLLSWQRIAVLSHMPDGTLSIGVPYLAVSSLI
jgi:hypothetical protein